MAIEMRHAPGGQPPWLYPLVWWSAMMYGGTVAVWTAYQIRLSSILEYGPVIHEFDPYFNYRATEVSCV